MYRMLLTILLIFSQFCPAAELAPAAKQEIAHLMAYLEHSGCRFNRNGSWYDAKDAVDHLNRKYEYLLDKGLVSSTETFISRAATESSMSSKPYLVRCNGEGPVASAAWFKAELANYRAHPQGH